MRLPTSPARGSIRLLTIAAALAGSPALAQESDEDSPWSFEGVIASEYISKGTGKSGEDPGFEARIEREFGMAYAGAWAANAITSQGGDAEFQLYAGAGATAGPFELDGRITYKTAPGTADGFQDDWIELRGSASTRVGKTRLALKVEYSPDSYALTEQAWWAEAEVSRPIAEDWTVSAGYGVREQDGGADYRAWNAGVTWELRDGVALDLRWYDTDSHSLGANYDGRLHASVTVSF